MESWNDFHLPFACGGLLRGQSLGLGLASEIRRRSNRLAIWRATGNFDSSSPLGTSAAFAERVQLNAFYLCFASLARGCMGRRRQEFRACREHLEA